MAWRRHNRENKTPAYPHALFKMASISKLYDASAITRLAYGLRLTLDKTLADYFPELAGRIEYADKIMLRLMVQHCSDIPNFTYTPGYWMNPPKTSQAGLDLVLDMPASFEPGEDYAYSITNYLLISQLIKKTTGKSKFDYIKEEFLTQLGLNNTFGSIREVNMDDLMSGYYVGMEAHIKAVVAQFVNMANFSDYQHWELSEIVYNRIVKILRKKNKS